jgi:hypothetical protein
VAPIELTIPREREFGAVADLVLAGIASRVDLTLETIDDLQLALESLLEHEEGDQGLTIRFDLVDGAVHASVGPFDRDGIEPALAAGSGDDGIGLRRVLATTVDGVELSDRDGGCWVELRKEVAPA